MLIQFASSPGAPTPHPFGERVNPLRLRRSRRLTCRMPLPLDGRILQQPRSPEPVEIAPPRVWDERLGQVLPPHARLLSLYADATWAEGPVWWPGERSLIFSDVIGRRTLAWRGDGSIVTVRDRSDFANGNAMDAEGVSSRPSTVAAASAARTRAAPCSSSTSSRADRSTPRTISWWRPTARSGSPTPRTASRTLARDTPAEPALTHQSVYRWHEQEGLRRMIDLDQPNGSPSAATRRRFTSPNPTPTTSPRWWPADGTGRSRRRAHPRDGGCRHPRRLRRGQPRVVVDFERGRVVIVDAAGARLGVIPTPPRRQQLHFRYGRDASLHHRDSDLWVVELT